MKVYVWHDLVTSKVSLARACDDSKFQSLEREGGNPVKCPNRDCGRDDCLIRYDKGLQIWAIGYEDE